MNQSRARQEVGIASIFSGNDDHDPLALYQQAAPLVSMGAFACDLATERLSWTDGVYDIFGVSSEEITDRHAIVEMYCEESRELLERKRSRAIATCSGFSLDARVHRPDGAERWVRITAATRVANGRSETLYGMKQDITEDHLRWQRLRAQAECDPLTGVANRTRFQHFLEQPSDEPALNCVGALLLFDLDGFKKVNDHWGHAAGDACLVAFGKRLRKAFPQASLVSRIGGDEFAVLLPAGASRREAESRLRIVVANLLQPVSWNGDLLPLSASVGLAFASDIGAFDPQGLFVAADKALYNAKNSASIILACA